MSINGVNVRELNVKWLRQQVGLVNQEPTLFPTTIMDNILHGAPSASDEQVKHAAERGCIPCVGPYDGKDHCAFL